MPINIAQATLGSKISVKTLDGKKVAIKIPPGHAERESAFACAVRASRRTTSTGDLIVEVEVSVPEKLTEEQEKAMREFAEASGLKY